MGDFIRGKLCIKKLIWIEISSSGKTSYEGSTDLEKTYYTYKYILKLASLI